MPAAGAGALPLDLVDKKLYSPTTYKDFMGYCSPTWISDYTYKAIASRMSYIAGAPMMVFPAGANRNYRFVDVGADGKLTWGDSITLNDPPIAEPHTVNYVDESGAVVESATGHFYPYDDLPGGYMLVPDVSVNPNAKAISVTDLGGAFKTLQLPSAP